jgi:sugar/nucleoside kinase (ribokinase family)
MSAPEFVAVGHVTLDRFGDRVRPGGAALFAAVTAHRLGLSAGILTSHGDDFPLDLIPPQIEVVSVPAAETTKFVHRHTAETRVMQVESLARPLGVGDVPEDWRGAAVVLLAPVIDEVDPLLATSFPEATVAAAAQGWLRARDRDGTVTPHVWEPPEFLIGHLQAVFLSHEDVAGQEDRVLELYQRIPLGVVTAGREGAILFVSGERYEVRPRRTTEVDVTGAGDVFAAAFLVHYHRKGDPWDAAAAAACAASLAVEGEGWSSVPDQRTLEAAFARYQDD